MATRRIPRSRRAIGATGLLASAVVVAVVGIVVATVAVLTVASVYAVVVGIVATRLLSSEIRQLRRDWAYDRAQQADAFRQTAVAASRENMTFAEQMVSRLTLREAQLASMRDSVVTAEIELAQARERVSAERARNDALQSDVTTAQSDLESSRADLRTAMDALAESETAELQARAELLAWEEAATDETKQAHDRRYA